MVPATRLKRRKVERQQNDESCFCCFVASMPCFCVDAKRAGMEGFTSGLMCEETRVVCCVNFGNKKTEGKLLFVGTGSEPRD